MLPLWVTWVWAIIKELRSHKLHCVAKTTNKYRRKRKGREVILPQTPPAEPRRLLNRIFRLLKLDLPSSLLSSAETHYTDTCFHSLAHLSPCPYSQLSSLLQLPKSHQRTLNSLQTSTPTSVSVAPCPLCPSDPLTRSKRSPSGHPLSSPLMECQLESRDPVCAPTLWTSSLFTCMFPQPLLSRFITSASPWPLRVCSLSRPYQPPLALMVSPVSHTLADT